MKLRTTLSVILTAWLLAILASCFDPEPGEVGMNVSLNGQPISCMVLVFNEKGKQIQQESADQYGVVYVKKLPPGTYTFKFSGHDSTMYPAEHTVKVASGGSEFIKVELSQPPTAAPAT